jgi:6,7-dimethyl-8-ribityllumazine synthase
MKIIKKINLGIVVADFNQKITSNMEIYAEKKADSLGARILKKIHVPGAFEIPFASNKLLNDKDIDAVIVVGAVVQGETHHDIVIMNAVSLKLIELYIKYGKPIGFGIIGPRVSWKKASERSKEYSERAVEAAMEML